MRNYIALAALVSAAAFPAAARAECSLENVASPQEIAGGWTIHEDFRIVKQVDSAPYEKDGAGNWFVDRETTTLPIYVYQEAFVFHQLGYGTAISLVLVLIGAIFSLLFVRASRSQV